jgi:hypothetical protein
MRWSGFSFVHSRQDEATGHPFLHNRDGLFEWCANLLHHGKHDPNTPAAPAGTPPAGIPCAAQSLIVHGETRESAENAAREAAAIAAATAEAAETTLKEAARLKLVAEAIAEQEATQQQQIQAAAGPAFNAMAASHNGAPTTPGLVSKSLSHQSMAVSSSPTCAGGDDNQVSDIQHVVVWSDGDDSKPSVVHAQSGRASSKILHRENSGGCNDWVVCKGPTGEYVASTGNICKPQWVRKLFMTPAPPPPRAPTPPPPDSDSDDDGSTPGANIGTVSVGAAGVDPAPAKETLTACPPAAEAAPAWVPVAAFPPAAVSTAPEGGPATACPPAAASPDPTGLPAIFTPEAVSAAPTAAAGSANETGPKFELPEEGPVTGSPGAKAGSRADGEPPLKKAKDGNGTSSTTNQTKLFLAKHMAFSKVAPPALPSAKKPQV